MAKKEIAKIKTINGTISEASDIADIFNDLFMLVLKLSKNFQKQVLLSNNIWLILTNIQFTCHLIKIINSMPNK